MAKAKPHHAAAHAVLVTTVQNHQDSDWSSIDWAAANLEVKRLQQRIFRASQQQQWRKVRNLQKLLLRSRSNLVLSVRQVTQVAAGKRTPGVDGRVALDGKSRAVLVHELQQAPLTRPRPVRRAYVPKADGKLRPLGIPTIADRVRQHVVKTVLEPAWEPHFEARSYGFRPGRSTMDAIVATWQRLNQRTTGRWVLDADIRGAFDHISHAFLLRRLGNFPARPQVQAWLAAGYVEYCTLHETTEGTPQGGVISPLLANIALDGLEQLLWDFSRARKWHRPSKVGYFGFARYADDFIVTAADRDRLEQALPSLRHFLAERGLEFNEEKTRIVDAYDGFNFLGFTIRKYRHGNCLATPQKSKVLATLREWKRWLRQHANTKPASVIKHLNLRVGGWANYYQHVSSSRVYNYVDHRLWQMLWSWCIRRHPNKSRNWLYRRYFTAQDGRDWVFTGPDTDRRGNFTQAYLAKVYRPHRDHALVRGTASPLDPALAWYWQQRRMQRGKALTEEGTWKHEMGNRQRWLCQVCGTDLLNGEDLEQHHKIRVMDGGPDHPDNLELLHEACHYNDRHKERPSRVLGRGAV